MSGHRRKRRFPVGIAAVVAVMLIVTVIAAIYLTRAPKLIPTGQNRFHVGDEVRLSDLVERVENGELVTENVLLDSSREGDQTVVVVMKSRTGQEVEGEIRVTFWRETPVPVITAPETLSYSAVEGQEGPAFDPLAGVSAADEDGTAYEVKVEGEYDLKTSGEYTLTYVALDRDGKRIEKTAVLTVTVTRSPFDENGEMVEGVYTTSTGHELVIREGVAYVDGYMIVNKSFGLPGNFSSTGDGTRSLRPETAAAWQEMYNAAPADVKKNLKIRSGVRNIADQTVIFNNYVKTDGLENALTYSAKPGHSEHHTGLAMDITTSSTEACRQPEIAAVMTWLDENAWKYGFIKRYPEGKTDETGYIFEPWHYRYVGLELAEKLYNGGDWITMESYFGVDSEYKN
ncbi:MAG: D-alanyl-D-alanine carboxypeptidase family protein [Clostridia bacterium]|nr:D-alanyl-D-alanine carboxypeptidase family protein [Clostridia bacterium]